MNAIEEALKRALAAPDYEAALACLSQLPRHPATAEQAGEIAAALRRALQTARIQRAHDAARLAEARRMSAYRPFSCPASHTWQMSA